MHLDTIEYIGKSKMIYQFLWTISVNIYIIDIFSCVIFHMRTTHFLPHSGISCGQNGGATKPRLPRLSFGLLQFQSLDLESHESHGHPTLRHQWKTKSQKTLRHQRTSVCQVPAPPHQLPRHASQDTRMTMHAACQGNIYRWPLLSHRSKSLASPTMGYTCLYTRSYRYIPISNVRGKHIIPYSNLGASIFGVMTE